MRAVAVAGLVLLAGCGDGTGTGGGIYSCAEGAPGGDGGAGTPEVCIEVMGGTAQDLANNQSSCAAAHASFAFAPCSHTGALGGCREALAGSAITTWYYQGTMTVSDVQMTCAQAASSGLPVQFVSP
jgi:hypothetical protein